MAFISRKITGISNFAGVDYSTQRFKVSQHRAIDIQNFIYKDGVIQKRQGIEELFSLKPTHYIPHDYEEYKVNDTNFNGIWSVKGEDNKLHVIAHIGRLLYEIKNITSDTIEISLITTEKGSKEYGGNIYYYTYEFENYKSSAFVGANRLYFLGGNKYMCIRFLSNSKPLIYPIEDHEDTYVPTTTISITCKNSAIAGRTSLDKVNLLTQWRKNELLSGTTKTDGVTLYDYTLDSPLIPKNEEDMRDILITLDERGIIE